MPDLAGIVRGVLDLADKIAPLVGPGGTAAVAAAKSLVDLVDKVAPIASNDDQAALRARVEQLRGAVGAHADRVIDKLNGPPG